MRPVENSDADYFVAAGPTSDLIGYADRIAALPKDSAALGQIVRGLLLHDIAAEIMGIASSPERDGMQTFGAGPILDRVLALDAAPLDQPRPEHERLIGYCYHFALMHCAFLRAKGAPCRTRCGFASYLVDGKWTDHWVVEQWHDGQWLLNDPQIGIDELSHDDFRTGVQAWQLCRSGDAEPTDYGIGDLWGWDELRGSLVNDLGSLNKIEIGDWQWCDFLRVDPLDQPHPDVDADLDVFASLAMPGTAFEELHAAFESDVAIRPPDEVLRGASSL